MTRVRDEQNIKDGHTGRILDDQTIKRSGDVMCDLHHVHENEECGFLD
jgi:hypothetical protein